MSAYSRPDDILARAVAALREMPVPAGPSRRTVGRNLAVLRAAEICPEATRSHGSGCAPEGVTETPGSPEKR
jgi:hypothetical protein